MNPWLSPGTEGRFRELCTAGLAFKLLHAVVKHGRQLGLPEFEQYDIRQQLDLVGLGTIADLVPLTGENRILAVKGLEQIPGLIALGYAPYWMSPALMVLLALEAGFQIAPGSTQPDVCKAPCGAWFAVLGYPTTAEELAGLLDRNNRDRQRVEKEITQQVLDTCGLNSSQSLITPS